VVRCLDRTHGKRLNGYSQELISFTTNALPYLQEDHTIKFFEMQAMVDESESSLEIKTFKSEITNELNKWQKLRRINRNWDGGLTIATIVLALTTAIIGIDGLKLNDLERKLWIGVCGGLVVAIQSIGNAFPVKQRAGGYRLLYAQGLALKSKAEYLQSHDEITASLPQMRDEYYKLLIEASKIES